MSNFMKLPQSMRDAIIYNKFGIESDNLNERQLAILNLMSQDELWESWLEYEGIIGYAYRLKSAYETIFHK